MMLTKIAKQNTGGYHPYFAGRVAEDIHLVYRILKNHKSITVNELLYNYSSREGSFTYLQFEGKNAKYTYSWQLLGKIIHKDIHENIDVLNLKNINELKVLELQACEEALVAQLSLLIKLGRFMRTAEALKLAN
jgi:ACT domain-containing protein